MFGNVLVFFKAFSFFTQKMNGKYTQNPTFFWENFFWAKKKVQSWPLNLPKKNSGETKKQKKMGKDIGQLGFWCFFWGGNSNLRNFGILKSLNLVKIEGWKMIQTVKGYRNRIFLPFLESDLIPKKCTSNNSTNTSFQVIARFQLQKTLSTTLKYHQKLPGNLTPKISGCIPASTFPPGQQAQ